MTDGRRYATLRTAIAFGLIYLLIWSGMPTAALAEMAEGGRQQAEAAASSAEGEAAGQGSYGHALAVVARREVPDDKPNSAIRRVRFVYDRMVRDAAATDAAAHAEETATKEDDAVARGADRDSSTDARVPNTAAAAVQAFSDTMECLGLRGIVVRAARGDAAWNMVLLDGAWYHVDVWSALGEYRKLLVACNTATDVAVPLAWLLADDATMQRVAGPEGWRAADGTEAPKAEKSYGWGSSEPAAPSDPEPPSAGDGQDGADGGAGTPGEPSPAPTELSDSPQQMTDGHAEDEDAQRQAAPPVEAGDEPDDPSAAAWDGERQLDANQNQANQTQSKESETGQLGQDKDSDKGNTGEKPAETTLGPVSGPVEGDSTDDTADVAKEEGSEASQLAGSNGREDDAPDVRSEFVDQPQAKSGVKESDVQKDGAERADGFGSELRRKLGFLQGSNEGDPIGGTVLRTQSSASGTCGTNLFWSLSNGSLIITGSGDMTSHPWDDYADEISSVSLPLGLTSIDGYAFAGCTSLKSLELPETVKRLGRSIIADTAIESITVPASVTDVEYVYVYGIRNTEGFYRFLLTKYGPFQQARSLSSVILQNGMVNVPAGLLCDATTVQSVSIPGSVTNIGSGAFTDCRSLSSISLPSRLESIGARAFKNCSSLASVSLPGGLKSIGYDAFKNCSSLVSVALPSGLQSIDEGTFEGCVSLTSISLQRGLKSIGSFAFAGCTSLSSLSIPDTVTELGCRMIEHTAATSIVVPASVVRVRADSLNYISEYGNYNSGCWRRGGGPFTESSLTSVTLQSGMTRVTAGLLCGAFSLTSVSVPDSVAEVEQYSFYGSTSLADVYYQGDQKSWSAIKINGNENDPLLNARLNFVYAPVKRQYYGAYEYMTTSLDDAQAKARSFVQALDKYIKSVSAAAEKDAKKVSKSSKSHGEILRQVDSATLEKFATFTENTPEGAKSAAYEALAIYLDEYVSTGKDLGKINMKDPITKISAGMVSEIRNKLDRSSIPPRTIQGYSVSWDILEFMSTNFGTIDVSKGSKRYRVTICTPASDTAAVLTGYVKQLKQWEEDALYEAMYSVFSELGQVTGISDLTKDSIERMLKDKVQTLQSRGFGELMRVMKGGREGYSLVNEIVTAEPSNLKDVLKEAAQIKRKLDAIDLSDASITNDAVRKATEKLVKARDALSRALYNCVYDPNVETTDDFWSNLGYEFKRLFVECPVDVEIKSGDEVLGRVENDEVTYCSDRIAMRVDGDVKTIGIPTDMNATVSLTSTDEGTMTLVMEQVSDGEVAARSNWYGLELKDGVRYEQEVCEGTSLPTPTTSEQLSTNTTLKRYDSDGTFVTVGKVEVSEHLDATDTTAHVRVSTAVEGAGSATRSEAYPKGSPVTLEAYPEATSRFAGWYVGDELVSADRTYRFPALEDVEVVARFVPARTVDDRFATGLANAYANVAAMHVYQSADNTDDIALCLSGTDVGKVQSVRLRRFSSSSHAASDSTVSTSSVSDSRFEVGRVDLSGLERLEVYLTNGTYLGCVVPMGKSASGPSNDVSWATTSAVQGQTYNGGAFTPRPTVKLGGTTLGLGADYSLSYKDNVNAGTATVIVTGRGNYKGSKSVTFRIDPVAISAAAVTLGQTSYAYDGKAKTPGVTARYNGTTLVAGKDFTVAFSNNVNPGTAKVTITGKGNYTGTKTASFTIKAAKTFPDVPANAWYAGVVSRAVGLGLMSGYKDGRFGPTDKVTRGQVAVILWNMAGKPAVGAGAKTFPDVGAKDYFYNAVRWASSRGVVSGYGNGKFGPNDNVTREQLAVMLANYARNVARRQVAGSAADYAKMGDGAKVSSWAQASVGWCFKSGIISGTKDGNVNPKGNATRAEAAKMVVVLHDMLA